MANAQGRFVKVVLSLRFDQEYAEAVHTQVGHVGIRSLLVKVRQGVHCMDTGHLERVVRQAWEAGVGWSVSKPAGERRGEYGLITLQASPRRVDIIPGCANPHAELAGNPPSSKAPSVMFNTCKRAGFTQNVWQNSTVFSVVREVKISKDIRAGAQGLWTDNGKQKRNCTAPPLVQL